MSAANRPDPGQPLIVVIGEQGFPGFYVSATVVTTDEDGRLGLEAAAGVEIASLGSDAEMSLTYFREKVAYRARGTLETLHPREDSGLMRLTVSTGSEGFSDVNMRKFERFSLPMPIRYRPVSFPTGLEADPAIREQMPTWRRGLERLAYSTQIIDIGAGGVCTYLLGEIPLLQHDQVYAEIMLPDGPVPGAGKVAWLAVGVDAEGIRMGIEFVGLEKSSFDKIANFVASSRNR